MNNHEKIFNNYSAICWDFDKTLIDGVNSIFYQNYIKSTPNKNHYIVTFRNKYQASTVYEELENCKIITRKDISGLIYTPDDFYNKLSLLPTRFQNLNHKIELEEDISPILSEYGITYKNFYDAHDVAYKWKAEVCKNLGVNILVDDLSHIVKDHCDILGITYIDSTEEI